MTNQNLRILEGEFTIHRFDREVPIPQRVFNSDFYWIGKTDEELSIVCDWQIETKSAKQESGWKCIKLIGPFPFTETGIIASITKVLAENKIGLFVISTFDTDYVLVKKDNLKNSVEALIISGYSFIE